MDQITTHRASPICALWRFRRSLPLGDQPDPRGSSAEALAEGLPNAQLFFVMGAGHSLWLEQPEEFFAAVCRFLAPGAP